MNYRIFKNFAPRWIIFCLDLTIISLSFVFSFFLIDQYTVELKDFYVLVPGLICNLIISIIGMLVFATYKGIIRYSEIMDIVRVIKFALLQFAIWTLVYFSGLSNFATNEISYVSLIVNFVVVIFMMVAS